MPQSLARLHVHLVFSTKHREPFITDTVRASLHAYLATVLRNSGCPAVLINSMPDHVHILFELGPHRRGQQGCGGGQNQFIQMAENPRSGIFAVCVADGLWRVFGQRIERGDRPRLHCQSSRTSPGEIISRGIPGVSCQTWCGLRRKICLGLNRPFRAWEYRQSMDPGPLARARARAAPLGRGNY